MYTLYYSPGACSLAVHALLIETGAAYEVRKAADHQEELRGYNPRAVVPTLLIDGKVLREGAAILTHICEAEKSPLLPLDGFVRAKAMEWLAFANSTLHPKYGALFGLLKNEPAAIRESSVYTRIEGMIQQNWDEIELELETKDYINGDVSVADLLITVIAGWTPKVSGKVTFGKRTQAYLERIRSRPAFQQALEEEGLAAQKAA